MAQDKRGLEWLHTHRNRFGTGDGRPGAFHRECLFDLIRPGSAVMIEYPRRGSDKVGQLGSGRAVMRGPAGWVLNMGGRHGTPGIAGPDNTVWVAGADRVKLVGAITGKPAG